MALVTGPLLSVTASGKVANALVYTSWKTRQVVRRFSIPSNPKSVGQLSVRAMMKFLTQYWASLTENEQLTWEERAAAANISPFNAFIGHNQARWGGNNLPSKAYPTAAANTAGTLSAFTATPQSRSNLITCTIDVANDNWGINIFRGLTDAMGVTRSELVQTIPAESAASFYWLDYPLTAGTTYYYRCYPFSDDGVIGAAEDDINATPTA